MILFKKIAEAFIKALFPQRCIVCDKLIEADSYFCKDCKGKLELISDKICRKCGSKICECNRFIYHFDGVIAPFANEGYAQKAFYALKFGLNFSGVDYFAEKMAFAFKENFSDTRIDFVCFVPLSPSQLKEREFDKSEILARKVSDLLNLPLEKIILKKEGIVAQHNLKMDNRFDNVREAYKVIKGVKNKNILLVDDIKTTGATLDSCAKELKFAGAFKVFCLTALSSQND